MNKMVFYFGFYDKACWTMELPSTIYISVPWTWRAVMVIIRGARPRPVGGKEDLLHIANNKNTLPCLGKKDHFVIISDFKILVPRCSALFTLCNGGVRIVITYTVLE